ncbi:MAG: stimulus-sensing domain-containing protein, partial [Pseudomonadota bacterium]
MALDSEALERNRQNPGTRAWAQVGQTGHAAASLLSGGFARARAMAGRVAAQTERFRSATSDRLRPVTTRLAPIGQAIGGWAPVRALFSSIRARIIAGNVLGLVILLFGWVALSQQNIWLIDAKRDALETQSRIMATAVAQTAAERGAGRGLPDLRFDPDLIAEQTDGLDPNKPRGLDDLDFTIRPELVSPVVARLVEGSNTRVRIYSTDGTPVVDSSRFLRRDGLFGSSADAGSNRITKPKNFWTRFLKWRLASNLPVYQDIDGINGRSYPEVKRSLKDGKTYSMLLMTDAGEQVVAISAPVVRNGQVNGVLMLSTQPGDIGELLSTERFRILAFAVIALLATVAVSLWLARTVAQPLQELSEIAEEVSVDIGASERLPTFDNREDEVGQLARSFSNMTQTLRTRLQASEHFAADVAHELKNPLAAARGMAEALPLAHTEAQKADCVEQIQFELARLNRLITDVSDAQRLEFDLPVQQTHPVSLTEIAERQAAIFSDLLTDVTVQFETDLNPAATVIRCHEGRISQVLTNLVDNAGSFSPSGGTVTVRLSDAGTMLHLAVEDEGPGLRL